MKHKDRMERIASLAGPPPGTKERSTFESYLNTTRTPEIEKQIIKFFNIAQSNIIVQLENGSGLIQDQTIREFHSEYNSRNHTEGLWSMPSSFNVIESLFEFLPVVNYFHLKEELDYKISFNDYIDFITSSQENYKTSDVIEHYQNSMIYSYNNLDKNDSLVYKISESAEFIPYGCTIIRENDEINILSIFGIKDDKQRSEYIKPDTTSPIKTNIEPDPNLEFGAVTLDENSEFQKVITLTRLDLKNKKQNTRYIMRDYGNGYDVLTDDINVFKSPLNELSKEDHDLLKILSEQIDSHYSELFSYNHSLINISSYIEHNEDNIEIERVKTNLCKKRKTGHFKKALKDIDPKDKIFYRNIRVLNKQFNSSYDNLEIISPSFKIETKGFWKILSPTAFGFDKNGNKIKGKTWVTQTLSWYDNNKIDNLIRSKNKENKYDNNNSGFIYLMRNASHSKNIFKIGLTQRNTETRAAELSRATGQPDSFLIAYEWEVKNCKSAEKIIHEKMKNYRINDKREFFKADFSFLMSEINSIVTKINHID